MKKIALVTLAAAALALPAVANAGDMKAPAAAPAAAAKADTKVELKDGSWAMVKADGSVTVSKDGGKTWMPAPDGTWMSKDGKTTITTKGGKKA
ncbi:MAG: hypothetical protein KGJ06_04735 [Pseudomonadota bacterium]|nr:hypothetical protein [Pseudomonadota bacterium]